MVADRWACIQPIIPRLPVVPSGWAAELLRRGAAIIRNLEPCLIVRNILGRAIRDESKRGLAWQATFEPSNPRF